MRDKDEKHGATPVPIGAHQPSPLTKRRKISHFRVICVRYTTARSRAVDVGHPQWAADGRHALRRENGSEDEETIKEEW